jgi:Flp pilus assembly protein TadG
MFARLLRETSGAAAVEMALVAPLLIGLMYGSMELGYYFYSEHVVIKAVRDGARFASRASFGSFDCSSNSIDATVDADTQNLTRTNQIASGGSARLAGWTDNSMVDVSLSCVDNSAGTYGSIYQGVSSVPVVSVTATVPYISLFSLLGFHATNLTLTATSQAAVMGV